MQPRDRDFQSAHEIGKIYQSLTDRVSLCGFFLDSAVKFAGAAEGHLFLSGREDRLWLETSTVPENPAAAKAVQAAAQDTAVNGKPRQIPHTLFVPLFAGNTVLGVAVLTRPETEQPFEREDLDLAVGMAAQMAGSLKNLLLFEENLKMERLAAVGQTTGMVLHEIKNIMQLARLSYDFIKRGMENKKEQFLQRGMKNIERALRELDGFTMDMLSLTKEYALETEKTRIEDIFHDLKEDLTDKAADYQISLEFIVEKDFPDIEADKRALYRALLNLVKNAIEAVDTDKEERWVRVGASSAGSDQYLITIADNGMGMTEETRAKLFEAFFSTKGKKGTGLGLMIIDNTVRSHRGEIRIESEERKGTRFLLTLPFKIPSSSL